MATGVTTQKLFANAIIKSYDHDPGASSAVVVSGDGGTTKNYVDMRDYQEFCMIVFNSVSTSSSGPTLVEIVGATDTSGTGITVILAHAATTSTHVGDNIVLSVTAEQIKEVGVAAGLALRYLTGRITCSNSGDECVVTFIRHNPRWATKDLTADAIT